MSLRIEIRTPLAALVLLSGCASSAPPLREREPSVHPEGVTMVPIRGPIEFRMGSPMGEAGRNPASDSPDEAQHTARIPRSYAIATREVTVAQFRRFLEAHPEVRSGHAYADDPARMDQVMRRFSPDPDGPQIAVTWYEAAMFCNWLSRRDGLPPSEWVYPS